MFGIMFRYLMTIFKHGNMVQLISKYTIILKNMDVRKFLKKKRFVSLKIMMLVKPLKVYGMNLEIKVLLI